MTAIPPSNSFSAQSGFSRTELLVVLAVLIVMAGLTVALIPWIKSRMHQAHCRNNLKELATASAALITETGKPVPREIPEYPGGEWMGSLRAHYRSDEFLLCPDAPFRLPEVSPGTVNRQGSANQAWVRWTTDGKKMFTGSYGYNVWLHDTKGGKERQFFVDGAINVRQPARTPVLVDANWVGLSPMEKDHPSNDLIEGGPFKRSGDAMARCAISRHGGVDPAKAPRTLLAGKPLPGAVQMVLFDGHAELVPLEKLWNYDWHRDWNAPTTRPNVMSMW